MLRLKSIGLLVAEAAFVVDAREAISVMAKARGSRTNLQFATHAPTNCQAPRTKLQRTSKDQVPKAVARRCEWGNGNTERTMRCGNCVSLRFRTQESNERAGC